MAVALVAAGPATAQERGGLEARLGVSHARPPSGLEGEAASYVGAGLVAWSPLEGPDGGLWAALDGAVSVEGQGDDWASVAAGAGRAWPLGAGLSLGMEVEARAFTVGGNTPYRAATGEAAPRLAWSAGGVELFVEGRAGAGRSTVETTVASDGGDRSGGTPGPPGPGGQAGTVVEETTTDLWQVGGDAGLRLSLGAQEVEVRAGGWDATTGVHRRASVELRGGTGGLSWRAGAGLWDTPAGDELVGSVGLGVPLGGGWKARPSGGRARPDPLLGSQPWVQGGLEVRGELARFGGGAPDPLYRILEEGRPPRVRFTLEAPDARRVVLLGDFTGWDPVPMERVDGRWRIELGVRPGVHHFGFRVDGRWHVPEEAPGRVDDEWGRVNATLVVPR